MTSLSVLVIGYAYVGVTPVLWLYGGAKVTCVTIGWTLSFQRSLIVLWHLESLQRIFADIF